MSQQGDFNPRGPGMGASPAERRRLAKRKPDPSPGMAERVAVVRERARRAKAARMGRKM